MGKNKTEKDLVQRQRKNKKKNLKMDLCQVSQLLWLASSFPIQKDI